MNGNIKITVGDAMCQYCGYPNQTIELYKMHTSIIKTAMKSIYDNFTKPCHI